ncbi:hypothetical protein V8J88_12475 [Massilia sp. W12]|uniref:hypothetical protein n=1 Tax=Massilia sp. W12 TaxID=3126507 RepID=UPI0030CC9570
MKIFTHIARLFWLAGLILLWLLPRRPYEWAQQIDPGNPLAAQGGADGNLLIFSVLLCLVLTVLTALLYWRSRQRREKQIAAAMLLLAWINWLIWYWQ